MMSTSAPKLAPINIAITTAIACEPSKKSRRIHAAIGNEIPITATTLAG